MPRLYSYTIPYDDGAAPNPFRGLCTLAICKPQIRRKAAVGDWVVGFGSKNAPSGNLAGRISAVGDHKANRITDRIGQQVDIIGESST